MATTTQGFSSANPLLAKDTLEGTIARKKSSSSSQDSSTSSKKKSSGGSNEGTLYEKKPTPTTVVIKGQGYSVAPELQQKFIEQKQQQAQIQDTLSRVRVAEKQYELEQKQQQAVQYQRYLLGQQQGITEEEFNRKLKTGEIVGYSGIGLSPQQQARREALIKAGLIKETQRPKEFNLRETNPIPKETEYFVDTTSKEKPTFENVVRANQFSNQQGQFNPPITSPSTFGERIIESYNKLNEPIKSKITEPFIFQPISKAQNRIDLEITKLEMNKGIKGNVWSFFNPYTRAEQKRLFGQQNVFAQYEREVPQVIYKDVRENPLSYGLSFAGGYVIGASTKGAKAGYISIKESKFVSNLFAKDTGGLMKLPSIGKKIKLTSTVTSGTNLFKTVVVKGSKVAVPLAISVPAITSIITAPSREQRITLVGETIGRGSAFGFGYGGGRKTVGDFTDKVKIETPLRPVKKEAVFIEAQGQVLEKGVIKPKSSYLLQKEITPPIEVRETTAFRERFGLSPKKSYTKLPRIATVKTIAPATVGKPFLVTKTVTGRKQVEIIKLGGKQKEFKIKDFNSLSKSEKVTLENLFQKETQSKNVVDIYGKSVKRISPSLMKEFVGEETTLTTGQTYSVRRAKITPRKESFDYNKLLGGKQASGYVSISKTEPYLESEGVEMFKVRTELKEIPPKSKAYLRTRISRTTSPLKGILIEKKEVIVSEGKPIDFFDLGKKSNLDIYEENSLGKTIIGSKGKKSSLSTVQIQKPLLQKPIIKSTTIKPKVSVVTPKLVSQSIKASTTFGGVSRYSGTGQYELTTGGQSISLISSQQTNQPSIVQLQRPNTFSLPTQIQEPILVSQQKPVLKTKTKIIQKTKVIQKSILEEKLALKPQTKTIQKTAQKQLLKPQLKQLLKTQPKKEIKFSIRPSTTSTKTPPFYYSPKVSKSPLKSGGYTVSIRRYGRFRLLASNVPLSEAFSLGFTKTSRTLGASYKITPSSNKISIVGLRTPSGFYKKYSKKEGLVFIEKRKYRLSTTGEKREIKLARRRRFR